MATLDIGEMTSKITDPIQSVAKDAKWLLFAAGFEIGVTNKFRSVNPAIYPFTVNGQTDVLAQLVGSSTARMINPSWNGTADQTFSPGAILNKDTGIAIGLYAAKEIYPHKLTRFLWNVFGYFEAGRGVGRVFDDGPYMPTLPGTQPNLPTTGSWQGGGLVNGWQN